jgi:SAM-dependent methyltransferase
MTANYDRIARFYDVDMARNMPFDDVAFYAGVCAAQGGHVLELGCGNGRILLPLCEHGIDAVGIDSSAAMLGELRRKAIALSIEPRVCRMDLRALAFPRRFDVVLCGYSLITYLTTDADLARALAEIRRVLVPGGVFVADAFVPRAAAASPDFRVDYRRPFGTSTLVRSKRITVLGPQVNRIERRYQVVAADGALDEQVDIAEDIRPFAAAELRDALVHAGFVIDACWWDYASAEPIVDAQFCTFVARAP